jgi:calcineurin-like phosphoesterase family protein
MAGELLFVTGVVEVVPGTEHAQEVRQAFEQANKSGSTTIYVLGSLFAPGTSKDACISYLEALPGRKVLVTDMSWVTMPELICGSWHEVANEVTLNMWGRRIILAPDPKDYPEDADLLLHIGRRIDGGKQVRVLWSDWHDRFGPSGLNSIYALSVLAEQMAAGMIAVEPDDGR